MSLAKAFYAFYHELVQETCAHRFVSLRHGPGFCEDCGQSVRLVWVQVRCQGCEGRRVPKRSVAGHVSPVHKHCRGCGTSGYRMVKKTAIDAHEVVYSVACKELDYSEADSAPDVAAKESVSADFSKRCASARTQKQASQEGSSVKRPRVRAASAVGAAAGGNVRPNARVNARAKVEAKAQDDVRVNVRSHVQYFRMFGEPADVVEGELIRRHPDSA